MSAIPMNLTVIAALWLGAVIVLVPLAGLTARFAAVPVLNALTQWRRAGVDEEAARATAARLERLEEQLCRLAQRLDRAADETGRHAA